MRSCVAADCSAGWKCWCLEWSDHGRSKGLALSDSVSKIYQAGCWASFAQSQTSGMMAWAQARGVSGGRASCQRQPRPSPLLIISAELTSSYQPSRVSAGWTLHCSFLCAFKRTGMKLCESVRETALARYRSVPTLCYPGKGRVKISSWFPDVKK